MNNPFYYEPSPECLKAVKELVDWLYGKPSPFCPHPVSKEFRDEIDKGKMFGVLCYDLSHSPSPSGMGDTSSSKPSDCIFAKNHKLGISSPIHKGERYYLAAYSGQVCGRSDWPEFVPAVFDYLQPDGYFKQHEAEIMEINRDLTPSPSPSGRGDAIPVNCNKPQIDKNRRVGESEEDFIRRRQFENAELHRWKLRERARQSAIEAEQRQREDKINALKTLRRQKSDDLQRWLFRHFVMLNARGEKKNLLEINGKIPPAGSGECCEPKLLQYAFTHGLNPVGMAMFWWGESPKNEVRHHLHFYPACNSKCKPILKWMLQGIDVDPNPLESKEQDAQLASRLKTLYEDDYICVISKPSGLLSVPGKSGRDSVQSIMRRRYPDTESPLIVHRLDMDTSGLMVIAKTLEAYHNLQQQFAGHEIQKRYVAVLENDPSPSPSPSVSGDASIISLPLRPDLDDRPRQVVDSEYGKPAVTYYKFVDKRRVWLWPKTGRTHQLRVHCAHRLGLNNPIKGDRLYGNDNNLYESSGNGDADRLYLHAEELTFVHPITGRRMTFTDKAPF